MVSAGAAELRIGVALHWCNEEKIDMSPFLIIFIKAHKASGWKQKNCLSSLLLSYLQHC